MKRAEAIALAARHEIPLNVDFHTLPASTVDRITAAADEMKYRKPRNANGSRARYFYAYLRRCLGKIEDADDVATVSRERYPAGEGLRTRRFVRTGEFREPRAGEWYLSGAIPEAWRAPNALSTKFHILQQVE